MIIYANNIEFAEKFYPESDFFLASNIDLIAEKLFSSSHIYQAISKDNRLFSKAYLQDVSPQSQFDFLSSASDSFTINDNIICIAGVGNNFHGQHNRVWHALEGNFHISMYLKPDQIIENFNTGFTVLAALSSLAVADSIDTLSNKSGIKWVNDIYLNGKKVAGVIAKSRIQGMNIKDVIIGAGINIAQKPKLVNDTIIKEAGSLEEESKTKIQLSEVLETFLNSFEFYYDLLLSGNYSKLHQIYTLRNILLGEKIKLVEDTPNNKLIAEGINTGIGENLEIMIDGKSYIAGRIQF